jgi:quercetin dioxygenase-like cupin family protein
VTMPADPVIVNHSDMPVLGSPHVATIGLLADATETGGALSVVRVTLAEGVAGAQPHRHRLGTELFYLLSGRAQVLVGDRLVQAAEGDLLVVPPDVPHAFAALPGHSADLLIVIAPGTDRFEYFRMLERVALGTLPGDSLLREQERFDTWFLSSPAWEQR